MSFTGLYPKKKKSNEAQLKEFHRKLNLYSSDPVEKFLCWGQVFSALANETKSGKVVILLDEISWMASGDDNFLSQLKNAWDEEFKKNPNLVLVLCGSVSAWIEKNLLSHRGFFGRISLKFKLKELPLSDCNKFWSAKSKISLYERLKIFSVVGGVPKYLEEIITNQSADDNIKRFCFESAGLLFNDYDYIFSSMLERESLFYQKIVEALANGPLSRDELLKTIEVDSGGVTTQYLDELEVSGFISRDFTWNLKTGQLGKLSKYRLSDNYIRFYIKYIRPVSERIKNNKMQYSSLSSLPAWSSIMGLQVENLVLNNWADIVRLMGLSPDEIICDGPFFQRKTARNQGCQIDYILQTKLGTLYVCEVKFTRNRLGLEVITSLKQKIERMVIPKNTSIVPVLIHLGDVQDLVPRSVKTDF